MSVHRRDSCTFHRKVTLNKKTPTLSMSTIYPKQKKSVRFCDSDSLENVRLFVKTQMPKACRSDPKCPKQYSYHLRCPNWLNETAQTHRCRFGTAVRMEQVQLISETPLDNKTLALIGTCQVANLAFEKHVVIHYTLDDWGTVEEVDAVYKESISSSANTWDRFTFNIALNTTHHNTHKSLFIAIKYLVGGREFWDNNDGKNYEVDMVPKVELDLCQRDFSSSSDDDEDGYDEEEEEEEEEEEDDNVFDDCEELEHLSIQDNTPWSPPLSPITPSDDNSLWSMNSPHYFPPPPPPSEESPDRRKIHEFLRKHCFYNDYHRPASYIPYHSPPRCASPKPIRG